MPFHAPFFWCCHCQLYVLNHGLNIIVTNLCLCAWIQYASSHEYMVCRNYLFLYFCITQASLLLDDSPQEDSPNLEHRQSYGSSGLSGAVSELGRPMGREYLLRTLVPFPTTYSRPVPHRMFAVLLPNEFRLTGAFSQDTTFSWECCQMIKSNYKALGYAYIM